MAHPKGPTQDRQGLQPPGLIGSLKLDLFPRRLSLAEKHFGFASLLMIGSIE